ncbi:ABC transporter permease [Desulfatibacillum aliphaticivorans]|uniref:ABC transporter permease n=1 Tax=Desulfatibacillum aliphaticivorans TaxID=218208 RepID=UPI0004126496|nr:ABC transporter permease [Desulfatibacillum aliphaticivorans]
MIGLGDIKVIRFVLLSIGILLVVYSSFNYFNSLENVTQSAVKSIFFQKTSNSQSFLPYLNSKRETPGEGVENFFYEFHGLTVETMGPAAARSIRYKYFKSWGFTFCQIGFAALLIAAFSFVFAFICEESRHYSFKRIGSILADLFDSVPYILWALLFIVFARGLVRKYGAPNWLYILIVFTGFGLFLFSFLLRQNRRRILAIRKTGLFDAERMMGIGNFRLCFDLFYRQFLFRTFIRHVLYVAVFIMILDFSFSIIAPYNDPIKENSVFCTGGYYYNQVDYLNTLSKAQNREGKNFRDFLLEVKTLEDENASNKAAFMLRHHYAIIDPDQRKELRHYLSQAKKNKKDSEKAKQLESSSYNFLHPVEHETLFYDGIVNYYRKMNSMAIFFLLLLTFIFFDLSELQRDD